MRDRSIVLSSLASLLMTACPGGGATDPDGATLATGATDGSTAAATAGATADSSDPSGTPTTTTIPTTGEPESTTGSTSDTGGPAPECGDGVVDPGEACDDGPANAGGNSCKADCTHNVCGDGEVGPGEGCDDGNTDDRDACKNDCSLASCGDGVATPAEACDDGNADDTDACTATCTAATCSDGFVQPAIGEQCDDGPDNADDAACTTECRLAICGDGLVWDAGGGAETCDNGADNGPGKACNAGCQLNVCGDGDPSPAEGCDDGNLAAGDGCSPTCALEGCGNSVLDPGEACDDGQDGDDDDGCTDACKLPACGDGLVQASLAEQCDAGAANSNTGACTLACKLAVCGDGLVHAQVEQCDDGANNGPGKACKSGCTLNVCGDGDQGPGEQCDDGNQLDTDACTAACKPAACGDGFVQPGEQCDDGNQVDTDDCTNACQIDTCGDGVVQPGEACDDGDLDDLDGCTSACQKTEALDVAAGNYETCAVLSGGAVRCWGNGVFGSLGYANKNNIGDNEHPKTAGSVQLGGPAIDVETGAGVTCARMANGDLRCWGSGTDGLTGLGSKTTIGDNEHPDSVGPVSVGGKVAQIAAEHDLVCAVLENGDVRCWGRSWDGEIGLALGIDTLIGDDEVPSSMPPIKLGGKATQVTVGTSYACALLEGGAVRCWGRNSSGQLGLGHTQAIGDDEHPDSQPPVQLGAKALAVDAGSQHTCALLEGGLVRCWGNNYHHTLGIPQAPDIGDNEHPDSFPPLQLGGKAVAVGCGSTYSCAQLESGAVRCWGHSLNGWGMLGYPGVIYVGDGEHPGDMPPLMLGGTPTRMDIGPTHACVVLQNGTIRCWGHNDYGKLGLSHTNHIGDNEHPSAAPPVQVY